ncbi:hypothetical protein FH968_04360 [Buttiauxella sp. B2]|nr:hypothetical protein FH968_04360 [Buttiauxella sp. B2]
MHNFKMYIGGINDITYRYDIKKQGDIFHVRIFNIINKQLVEAGTKSIGHISPHAVMEECASHYNRNAKTLRNFFRWLGF